LDTIGKLTQFSASTVLGVIGEHVEGDAKGIARLLGFGADIADLFADSGETVGADSSEKREWRPGRGVSGPNELAVGEGVGRQPIRGAFSCC